MADFSTLCWPMLGRTTLTLALFALVSGLLLRPARPGQTLPHRAAWLATLLVGWSFLRLTIPLAWYEAAEFHPLNQGATTMLTTARRMLPGSHAVVESIAPGPSVHWPTVALAVWALGIAGLAGRWLVGYLRFQRHLPERQPIDREWEDQWQAILTAADVREPIRLRVTRDAGPLLCRLRGGYDVMVPVGLWRELNAAEREAILRHELAHYLRGDLWKSLAARVLLLPHWFNPAAWLAVRRFDEAAEWACDQWVVEKSPVSAYAQMLLKLGQQAVAARSPGVAARGGSLAVRIRRLLLPNGKSSGWKQGTAIAAICLAATLALLRVELVAKQPSNEGPPDKGESPAQKSWRIIDPAAATRRATMNVDGQQFIVSPSDAATPQEFKSDLAPIAPDRRGPFRKPPARVAPHAIVPIPTDASAEFVPIPTDPRADYLPTLGMARRFQGPRGETFATDGDGMHLWRLQHSYRSARPELTPSAPAQSYESPIYSPPTEAYNSTDAYASTADVDERPENSLEKLLQHDFGKSAGKRSIAGSGHAVGFESPGGADEAWTLTGVRIFGSRYGLPQPPEEDFHVWLCDDQMHELARFDFPYAEFKRGNPEWVTLKTKPTEVPQKFIICVGFNPEQTKGVYVHFDGEKAEHSLTGLPGQKPQAFSPGNWMIRATLAPPPADPAQ